MDTQFQPSFIPKKPVTSATGGSRSSGSVFYYIGVLVFSCAVIASVGVWGYEYYLNSRISKMESDLASARAVLEPDLIKELSKANNRFLSAEEILKNHVTLSSFFDLLQKITLQSVRFSSFSYDIKPEGIIIVMKGEAKSYASVALQAKTFSEDPGFLSVLFSDLDLNEDGNVVFTVKATLNPEVISYAAQFEDVAPLPLDPVSVPVSTTTPVVATSSPATVATSTASSTIQAP